MRTPTHAITVSGNYNATFHFFSIEDAENWVTTDLAKMVAQYGMLKYYITELNQFKVGDECFVNGDGDQKYIIERIDKYSENNWYAALDSGFRESLHKCHHKLFEDTKVVRIGKLAAA